MQSVGNGEDGHTVDGVHGRECPDVHLDEAAPRCHQSGLRLHRGSRRGTGARDGGGDADSRRVLADVPLVEPEQVEFLRVRLAQCLLITGTEQGTLGECGAAGGVPDVAAEDGAGPPP
jgi:hypothetical protein